MRLLTEGPTDSIFLLVEVHGHVKGRSAVCGCPRGSRHAIARPAICAIEERLYCDECAWSTADDCHAQGAGGRGTPVRCWPGRRKVVDHVWVWGVLGAFLGAMAGSVLMLGRAEKVRRQDG